MSSSVLVPVSHDCGMDSSLESVKFSGHLVRDFCWAVIAASSWISGPFDGCKSTQGCFASAPTRPMEPRSPCLVSSVVKSLLRNWPPRSECTIVFAGSHELTARNDFMRESMEYPTMRRDEQSMIAHTKSSPALVACSLISRSRFSFTCVAVKSRLCRSSSCTADPDVFPELRLGPMMLQYKMSKNLDIFQSNTKSKIKPSAASPRPVHNGGSYRLDQVQIRVIQ